MICDFVASSTVPEPVSRVVSIPYAQTRHTAVPCCIFLTAVIAFMDCIFAINVPVSAEVPSTRANPMPVANHAVLTPTDKTPSLFIISLLKSTDSAQVIVTPPATAPVRNAHPPLPPRGAVATAAAIPATMSHPTFATVPAVFQLASLISHPSHFTSIRRP